MVAIRSPQDPPRHYLCTSLKDSEQSHFSNVFLVAHIAIRSLIDQCCVGMLVIEDEDSRLPTPAGTTLGSAFKAPHILKDSLYRVPHYSIQS